MWYCKLYKELTEGSQIPQENVTIMNIPPAANKWAIITAIERVTGCTVVRMKLVKAKPDSKFTDSTAYTYVQATDEALQNLKAADITIGDRSITIATPKSRKQRNQTSLSISMLPDKRATERNWS